MIKEYENKIVSLLPKSPSYICSDPCNITQNQIPMQPTSILSPTRASVIRTRVNKICQKIIDCGLNHLLFGELCYLHEIIYVAASRLQDYARDFPKIECNLSGRSRRIDGRIRIMEAELVRCKDQIKNLRDGNGLECGDCKMSKKLKNFHCDRNFQRSW